MSEYGRELSDEELSLCAYYKLKDSLEFAMKTGRQDLSPNKWNLQIDDEDFKVLKQKFKEAEELICQMFLKAVDSHDGERIIKLANAASFFKDKRPTVSFTPADRERALLLSLNDLLKATGGKATIQAVALFLLMADDPRKAMEKIKVPEDGYSALRRKCKALGIPIEPSRKTSGR